MSTEEMIENIIDVSVKAYKRNSRGSIEASMLDQHRDVVVDGITFNYWREYVVYKVCEYLKDKCPEAEVECNLKGNQSYIVVHLTDEQQKNLNVIMNKFLKTVGAI